MERMFRSLKKEKDPIQRSTIFYNIMKDFMFPLLMMGNRHKTDTPAECIAFVALMQFMDSVFAGGSGDRYSKLLFIKDVIEKEIEGTDEMKLFKDLEFTSETLH